MSSFEIGAGRPVGAIQTPPVSPAATTPAVASPASAAPEPAATSALPSVETSLTTSAGSPPVDIDRTTQIRQAVQNGSYPIIPTKIGDAMIAAGVLLRKAS
jgi:negative regulator of flagellin synthesis FlgM